MVAQIHDSKEIYFREAFIPVWLIKSNQELDIYIATLVS